MRLSSLYVQKDKQMSKIVFTGGREKHSPEVEIVDSDYHNAEKDEKMIRITVNGKALNVSFVTLLDIIDWAKTTEKNL